MVTKRILTFLVLLAAALLLTAADNPPPMLASDETEAELAAAFFDRLNDFRKRKSAGNFNGSAHIAKELAVIFSKCKKREANLPESVEIAMSIVAP